jgi:hypothetical protein
MVEPKLPWGPVYWSMIHNAALNYPDRPTDADKLHYKAFFNGLVHVIPCQLCRQHYEGHLHVLPVVQGLSSRTDLFAWTVHLHNAVNRHLGKKQYTMKQALAHWTRPQSL